MPAPTSWRVNTWLCLVFVQESIVFSVGLLGSLHMLCRVQDGLPWTKTKCLVKYGAEMLLSPPTLLGVSDT